MQLTNYYWYFQSAVPARICDEIVKYGKSISDQMAVTGGMGHKKLNQKQIKDLKQKRDSNIVWMNDRWIYKEIQPYVHQANASAGWNFQWDYSESCQFTKYEKGQFYDWHCDGWDRPYQRQEGDPSNGKIRKLSVTVSLSEEIWILIKNLILKNVQKYYQKDLWLYFLVLFGTEFVQLKKDLDIV